MYRRPSRSPALKQGVYTMTSDQRPNFSLLPDDALLSITHICAPIGPVPYRRSKFYEMVAAGLAPAPAMRRPRCTRWKWIDIKQWLVTLAEEG